MTGLSSISSSDPSRLRDTLSCSTRKHIREDERLDEIRAWNAVRLRSRLADGRCDRQCRSPLFSTTV